MRNQTLDIMKAVGIFLVIIGHNSSGILTNYIYSFHMPLFFIIAGYFWKERNIVESFVNDFKRILLPYISYFIIFAVFGYIYKGISCGAIIQDVFKICWGSCDRINIAEHHIQGVGFLWFLPALFVCKEVFNAIYSGIKGLGLSRCSMYVCMYVWAPEYYYSKNYFLFHLE